MEERIAPNFRRALQRVANGRAAGPRKVRRFLEHLAATCNVAASARAAGVDTSSMYQMRKRDPNFAAAWKDAMDDGYARLEEELLARALAGVTPTAFDPGAVDLELVDADAAPDGAGGDDGRTSAGERGGESAGADGASAAAPNPIPARRDGATGDANSRPVAMVDVRLALQLLNRRDLAERNGRQRNGRRRASAEEVGEAINAKLDSLAARLVEQRD